MRVWLDIVGPDRTVRKTRRACGKSGARLVQQRAKPIRVPPLKVIWFNEPSTFWMRRLDAQTCCQKWQRKGPVRSQSVPLESERGPNRCRVPEASSGLSAGGVCRRGFYIQTGKAVVTAISEQGKEAVVAVLWPGDFFGEDVWPGRFCVWRQWPRSANVRSRECRRRRSSASFTRSRPNGQIEVHRSLINLVLHEQPEIRN